MAVKTIKPPMPSEDELSEGKKELPKQEFISAVIWALEKLILIEQRLYSTGVFDLVGDFLQAQEIELLQLLKDHPQQARQIWFFLNEPADRVWLEDLTEVLVWAFRELRPIENRLYSAGVFDYADDFLADQEMALLQLLRKAPDQVRRELLVLQHNQERKNQTEGEAEGENS